MTTRRRELFEQYALLPSVRPRPRKNTTRRRRRLSFRQAVQCELDLTRDKRCRCRCGGKFRGARRCDPRKPSVWDFARLDKSDPHYLPAPRRRIFEKSKGRRADGSRRAVQVLAYAKHHLCRAGRMTEPARQTLRAACSEVDQVVAAERLASERRWRWYRFKHCAYNPAAVLQSAVDSLLRLGGDALAVALLLDAKKSLDAEQRAAVVPDRVVYRVALAPAEKLARQNLPAQWLLLRRGLEQAAARDSWEVWRADFLAGQFLRESVVAARPTKRDACRLRLAFLGGSR